MAYMLGLRQVLAKRHDTNHVQYMFNICISTKCISEARFGSCQGLPCGTIHMRTKTRSSVCLPIDHSGAVSTVGLMVTWAGTTRHQIIARDDFQAGTTAKETLIIVLLRTTPPNSSQAANVTTDVAITRRSDTSAYWLPLVTRSFP